MLPRLQHNDDLLVFVILTYRELFDQRLSTRAPLTQPITKVHILITQSLTHSLTDLRLTHIITIVYRSRKRNRNRHHGLRKENIVEIRN